MTRVALRTTLESSRTTYFDNLAEKLKVKTGEPPGEPRTPKVKNQTRNERASGSANGRGKLKTKVKRANLRASKRTPEVNWANRKETAKAAEKKKRKRDTMMAAIFYGEEQIPAGELKASMQRKQQQNSRSVNLPKTWCPMRGHG